MKYLLDFYAKYPQSQTQDFVKLLYQAEFGCEHIMGDFVLKYIENELDESNNADITLVEPISDEYCRVHLSEYKRKGYLPAVLAKCMQLVKSSGSVDGLNGRLNEFLQAVDRGEIKLSAVEAHSLIDEYRQLGCPAVRHSQVFRDLYSPHYRVIYRKHAVVLPILSAVTQALNARKVDMGWKKPIIVAIDGYCGSGKTYYSKIISEYFNASCIHCDDFFLPTELRTAERLSEVGGNVHYERLAQVLAKVQQGKPFTYQAYNCSTGEFVDRNFIPTDVVIVEGSYALHSTLRRFYDLKVLFAVNADTQYNRLLKREGAEGVINFVNKWIPLENRYFDALDVTDCLVINTEQQ